MAAKGEAAQVAEAEKGGLRQLADLAELEAKMGEAGQGPELVRSDEGLVQVQVGALHLQASGIPHL